MLRILDSCGWVYYFAAAPLGPLYASHIRGEGPLLIPSLVLFEVHFWARQNVAEEQAAAFISVMQARAPVVELDGAVALLASELRLEHRIPAVDSLIYAHAVQAGCILVTSDEHLRNLPGVEYHATPGRVGDTKKAKRAAQRPPGGAG